ncbi:MAG: twin-arginine translocase subunit TatC [Rubrobacter sp.]
MTLIEHLDELRSRIIKVGVAFVVVAIAAWVFRNRLLDWLLRPSGASIDKLTALAPTEQLMTQLKLCLYVGLMLTIPWLIYQAWAFVAPAVGDTGRAFTYVLTSMSSVLFLAGAAFGYYVVLPIGLGILLDWDTVHFKTEITSQSYLAFITRSMLAFGIVFELPAIAYVGAKLGLIDAPLLKRYRRHAIVANFLVAAAITPGQDVVSMLLMAVPMVLLYELSVVIARHVNPVTEVEAHEIARREHESADDHENGEDEHLHDKDEEPERDA